MKFLTGKLHGFFFCLSSIRHNNQSRLNIIYLVMEMSGAIYADVLVVINFYVTYFLLLSASLLSRVKANRLRLVASSLFGGLYSLFIFLPREYRWLTPFLKLITVFLPVLIAFGFKSLKAFLRVDICYLMSNFLFAGLMLAIRYFFCPSGMYFEGSVVYFDVDILTLVLLTVAGYVFLKLFDAFFKSRAPINTVFYCSFERNGKSYPFKAFLDTGNNLKDSFTGKPVIVLNTESFKDKADFCNMSERVGTRFILCSTVSGKSLLPAFIPERVEVKGAEKELSTDFVMIAITEEKILNGEFDAVLPMGLFQNISIGKDEADSDENNYIFKKAEREAFSVSNILHQRLGKSSGTADKGKGE